jgi:hypothetical protein
MFRVSVSHRWTRQNSGRGYRVAIWQNSAGAEGSFLLPRSSGANVSRPSLGESDGVRPSCSCAAGSRPIPSAAMIKQLSTRSLLEIGIVPQGNNSNWIGRKLADIKPPTTCKIRGKEGNRSRLSNHHRKQTCTTIKAQRDLNVQ